MPHDVPSEKRKTLKHVAMSKAPAGGQAGAARRCRRAGDDGFVAHQREGVTFQLLVLVGVMIVLTACARDDEAAMRARLDQWFSLGETVAFAARGDCAAGVFHLRGDGVAAAMPMTDSVGEMLRLLDRRGRALLDDPGQPPDAALVEIANTARATGQTMRRAALEARDCLDDAGARAAVHAGLTAPAAMLAYDRQSGTVMVIDRAAERLVALMGAG